MVLTILSPRDQEIMVAAISYCIINPEGLKIDYDRLGQHVNLSPASACRGWNKIRQKIVSSANDTSTTTDTTDTVSNNDTTLTNHADTSAETPVKKKRGRPAAGDGARKRGRKGGKKGQKDGGKEGGFGGEDEDGGMGVVGVKLEGQEDLEEGDGEGDCL